MQRGLALLLMMMSACTSDAELGYWKGAPLASAPGDGDGDRNRGLPPLDAGDGLPDGARYVDGVVIFPERVQPLCLRNPSLDGLPFAGVLQPETWWPADAWDLCINDAEDFPPDQLPTLTFSAVTIVDQSTQVDLHDGRGSTMGLLPPATHGVAYLHLDSLRGLPERTTQMMCTTLEAGVRYAFAIDLASRAGQVHEGKVLARGRLEIHLGSTGCTHDAEADWTSPELTTEWQTYCVELTPAQDADFITLQLAADLEAPSAILADNIRLDPSCD